MGASTFGWAAMAARQWHDGLRNTQAGLKKWGNGSRIVANAVVYGVFLAYSYSHVKKYLILALRDKIKFVSL